MSIDAVNKCKSESLQHVFGVFQEGRVVLALAQGESVVDYQFREGRYLVDLQGRKGLECQNFLFRFESLREDGLLANGADKLVVEVQLPELAQVNETRHTPQQRMMASGFAGNE